MDYAASRRVQHLVTSLTEPKASTLDDDKLTELKALLRQSEELVAYATPLLIDRLGASHSQARKLCVEVCAVLFSRSRRFRQLLSQQFTTFVELTVGHRSDLPLPGPPALAQALRARALEVIEEWHETWGQHYPQVTAAYRYLKKQYKFPEIASRAAAAAAEAAARMQRHQQLLLQRYNTFLAEFPQQRGQLDSLVQQIQECFQLLSEQPQQQQQQQQSVSPSPQPPSQAQEEDGREHSPAPVPKQQRQQQQQQPGQADKAVANPAPSVAAEAAEADEQWEDVPAAAAEAPGGTDDGGGGDLDIDELIGDYHTGGNSSGVDAELAARNASLLDQLSDLCRQAALAARRPLLEWLRLLTQVQMQEPQQEAQQRQYQQWQQERQGLLREVVRLRAQLQALIEEASTTWGVSVTQSTKRAASTAAETADPAPAAAAAAAGGAATTPVDAVAKQQPPPGRGTSPDLASLPSKGGASSTNSAQQQTGPRAGHHLTLGSSLQRLQQQQQRQQQAVSRPVTHDPYVQMRDPTVAVGAYTIPRDIIARNEELKFFSSPPDAGNMLSEPAAGITAAAAAAGGASNTADKPAASAEDTAANTRKTPSKAAAAGPGSATVNRKRPAEGTAGGRSNPRSEVLKKLAASAPQLPISGEDWLLAAYGVTRHGMEVYNHWGAVDASVGLPKDRVGQLMGYAASYYVPKQQQGKGPATAASGGGTTQPTDNATGRQQAAKQTMPAAPLVQGTSATGNGKGRNPLTSAGLAAAAAAGDSNAAVGIAAGTQKQACGLGQEASAVTPAAVAARMPPSGSNGSQQRQQHQPQRQMSHRQAASAHNRAVLAGAFTDEGIAAALQQQLNEEAAAEAKERKKGRAKKDPERKVDKIRKHLLG